MLKKGPDAAGEVATWQLTTAEITAQALDPQLARCSTDSLARSSPTVPDHLRGTQT